MTASDVLPVLADMLGYVLAVLLGWAALFALGPLACLVLLVMEAAGEPTPDGSGWLYVATAAAWLSALLAWSILREVGRGLRRFEATLGEWFAPLARRRPRRVIIVDAATGMPLPGQSARGEDASTAAPPPGWEWSRKREEEFRDWARTAARVKATLREQAAAAAAAAGATTAPPWSSASTAPPRTARPPRGAEATGARTASPPPRPQAPPPPPPPPPQAPAAPDPWATLGVPRGAGQDAIRRAYRDLVKQYHPDRVAGMPKEFQAIAHDKTREIRAAYETLRRGR